MEENPLGHLHWMAQYYYHLDMSLMQDSEWVFAIQVLHQIREKERGSTTK